MTVFSVFAVLFYLRPNAIYVSIGPPARRSARPIIFRIRFCGTDGDYVLLSAVTITDFRTTTRFSITRCILMAYRNVPLAERGNSYFYPTKRARWVIFFFIQTIHTPWYYRYLILGKTVDNPVPSISYGVIFPDRKATRS